MSGHRSRLERIAHRGMPRLHRENTLSGFAAALDAGADAIELDVHVTADGVVVVHHDPDLAGRPIASQRWSAVRAWDLGGGARVPRLEDVFALVGDRAAVYVELKGARVEEPAIAAGRAHGRAWAVHSFDHAAIERAAALAPDVPRGVLIDRDVPDAAATAIAAMTRTHARDVWPHWSLVDAAFVGAVQSAGGRVLPWTVNDPATVAQFHALGVDGICTDDVRGLANP